MPDLLHAVYMFIHIIYFYAGLVCDVNDEITNVVELINLNYLFYLNNISLWTIPSLYDVWNIKNDEEVFFLCELSRDYPLVNLIDREKERRKTRKI